MDKVLNSYDWDTIFGDFQQDVEWLSEGQSAKETSRILKDMKVIRDTVKSDDIKRSRATRHLANVLTSYTKDVKHDVKTNNLDDLGEQVDYLDNYTDSGWKQQAAQYQNN